MQSAVTVERIGEAGLSEWQSFVDASGRGGAMHQAAWFRVLTDAFGARPWFLLARRTDRSVCGVLPMYFSNSLFFGRHLSSLEDGLLASDAEAERALVMRAIEERDRVRARYVVVRGVAPGSAIANRSVFCRPTIRRVIDTSAPIETTYSALDRRVKREIRRAESAGYSVQRDETLQSLDGSFYDAYAEHVHQLGTPVMTRRMMGAIKKHMDPERVRLYLVGKSGAPIAGGILGFLSARGFSGWYGVVRNTGKDDYATYLLYWKIIEDLTLSAVATFDLGRSAPRSGSYMFKKKWPGIDHDVLHAFYARPGADISAEAALYEGMSAKQRLWKQLPLPVANAIGPLVRRQLPFG